jgi:hypothetical protein
MLASTPTYGEEYMYANEPCQVLEDLRVNFLKSLAHTTAKLRTLEFSQIGVPIFEQPEDDQPSSFVPVWRWLSNSYMQEITHVGPFDASREFLQAGFHVVWNFEKTGSDNQDYWKHVFKGVHQLL